MNQKKMKNNKIKNLKLKKIYKIDLQDLLKKQKYKDKVLKNN